MKALCASCIFFRAHSTFGRSEEKISPTACENGENIVQYEDRIEKDVVPSVFGRGR